MSQYDESPSVYNGHYEIQAVIDRPVAEVWKQFLDIGSWVTSHSIENVEGEPGTLGSVTPVAFLGAAEGELPAPAYHYCKIIRLIPEQRYMLKTYSEQGGSYGLEIVAFDDARFAEADGTTTITFNLYFHAKGDSIAQNPD